MDGVWSKLWACYILLYCFIFDSATAKSPFNFKERNWRRNVCLEEKNLTGAVSISTSTSLLLCASLCFGDQNCITFEFNNQQQKCHGYSAIDPTNNRGTYANYLQPILYNHGLTIHREKQNFENALATCAAECRRLLILDTAEKISHILSRTDLPGNYWIGMTDQNEEGQWIWVDGSKFVPFHSQLPTNFNNVDNSMDGSQKFNADCAVVYTAKSGIYDEHCSDLYKFICETY